MPKFLDQYVRKIHDFPKPGIIFKDLSPILESPEAMDRMLQCLIEKASEHSFDGIVGIESRGFLFATLLAHHFKVPFYMVRKKGKLPAKTISKKYTLEYGVAELEVHKDSIKPGMNILIHDDLLATGGSAVATASLLQQLEATIVGFVFMMELDHLKGRGKLEPYCQAISSVLHY